MSATARYIFIAIGVIIIGLIVWYFSNILVYILISLVLAFLGRPLYKLMEKIRIGKLSIPSGIRALVTLIVILTMVMLFFGFFIPLVVNKVQELSQINPERIIAEFEAPLEKIEDFINTYHIKPENNFSIEELVNSITSNLNVTSISRLFGSVASWVGNIFIALFSICFITFFFLKDEKMFSKATLSIISDKYVDATDNALSSAGRVLTRYITGVLIEMLSIIMLSTIGLLLIGFSHKDALLVGFLAGIFNIIPYLGPAIGTILGLLTGVLTYFTAPGDVNLLLLVVLTLLVFGIVQLIDNIVIQPFVYSKGVYAHPLEIFLVFLVAGSLGGIIGMILAIPTYTVIRIFAKEFFNNIKLVQSITRNI